MWSVLAESDAPLLPAPGTPESPEPSEKSGRPVKTCYQRAIDLLAIRAHFTAEMRRKLRQRGFEPGEVNGVLIRLEAENYLNDFETAHLWVEQQLARKPQGPSKLLAGLLRKGVSGQIARQVVTELVTPQEDELVERAVQRWQARTQGGGRSALARHLDRLGFHGGVILRAINTVADSS